MYEIMRYWDEDCPDWGAEERDFAAAWRSQPKWVVSRTLQSVGPNATLVEDDIEAVIRGLKAQPVGEIEVAGPDLAGSLTNSSLPWFYLFEGLGINSQAAEALSEAIRPAGQTAACVAA